MDANQDTRPIWLIGTGPIGVEYAKILDSLGEPFLAIGRGEASAKAFWEAAGQEVVTGGLESFLGSTNETPQRAIVAVNVEALFPVTMALLDQGVREILVEKPAGLDEHQKSLLAETESRTGASVFVAYKRRFYSSIIAAERAIQDDDGVVSLHFEFTEWSHKIVDFDAPASAKKNWFLANSAHVVNMAFFLVGFPTEMCSFVARSLPWHTAASVFAGSGVSDTGALFSYQAN